VSIGRWAAHHRAERARSRGNRPGERSALPPRVVKTSLAVLVVLIFSKYVYMVSLTSYYTFYLIHRFKLLIG